MAISSPVVRWRPGSMHILILGVIAFAVASRWPHTFTLSHESLATAGTVFSGVFVQAVPFLVFGVVVSGLIAAFLPAERLARWLPQRGGTAIVAIRAR
ncbi:MAG: permease, partial [Mycobacterium sp.]|nr:permease [Mycobacterium sp.]